MAIFSDIVKLPALGNPLVSSRFLAMSNIRRFETIFVSKFSTFRFHGNKLQSGVNFNDNIRFSDRDFLKRVGYFVY